MNEKIKKYIAENTDLMYETLKELCLIPAPSHFEDQRAEYCKHWLEKNGAKNVFIDDAKNVIFPINCEGKDSITVFAAHTDTVFPDREPMLYLDDGEKVYCPGAADDTASVVLLLITAKFFLENDLVPENGLMFVLNSCEEGLGNLKGARKLFESYEGKIGQFITLDSTLNILIDRAVGSHRYEVLVTTEGGHSFNSFGNRNSIAALSKIVNEIYKIKVPEKEGTKTTYNVGIIEGGTSVNTIAQSAKMLCEYRSDDMECMKFMENEFQRIFEEAKKDADVEVKKVGDRPCSSTDQKKVEALKDRLVPGILEIIDGELEFTSGSTDCNIPLSLGIPAVCIGTDIHEKTHTREEWVDKKSLIKGLEITMKSCLELGEIL